MARRSAAVLGLVLAAVLATACSGGGSPSSSGSGGQASSASATAPSASASTGSQPPPIVAVTSAGALVTLNPATGGHEVTLVPSGVLGDEISVSSGGTVYFATRNGNCSANVESVPLSGGSPTVIAVGSLPAISPDGLQLAYASQPVLTVGCNLNAGDITTLYHLDVRTLSTGVVRTLAMVAPGQSSGPPFPISHLSWSPTGQQLAVSIAAVQDNEGWQVDLLNMGLPAPYYLSGPGVTNLPVTGSPDVQQSYLREGIYLPDGDLFVSRACCAGDPVRNTSRLMWEVTPAGALVHQVAIGYANLDHTSLAASPDGHWLLYLAGTDLYLSAGGATPRELATGLIAAAFA